MNALTRLGAMVAILWLAFYCFDTLANNFLGYACIVAAFALGVGIFYALGDDLNDLKDFKLPWQR